MTSRTFGIYFDTHLPDMIEHALTRYFVIGHFVGIHDNTALFIAPMRRVDLNRGHSQQMVRRFMAAPHTVIHWFERFFNHISLPLTTMRTAISVEYLLATFHLGVS
jgi:hypothetical protein